MPLNETPFIAPNPTDVTNGLIKGSAVNMLEIESVDAIDVPFPQENVNYIQANGVAVNSGNNDKKPVGYYIVFNKKAPGAGQDKWWFKTSAYRNTKLAEIKTEIATTLLVAP